MLRLYNARPPEPPVNWPWTAGVLAAHGLALLALVGLAMANPRIPVWMARQRRPSSLRRSPLPPRR
jgi:hypothetical protein